MVLCYIKTDENHNSDSTIKSIRIPSSVTLFGEHAFSYCDKLQRIEIPDDSKLKTIDNNAFFCSPIESITIPSELVDLKEEWCFDSKNITEIIVSPNNPRYCLYEGKILLCKTSIEENNYENLIFGCRNIKHFKLPSFIKHICPYSFYKYKKLKTVEIPSDSKLQTIDTYAFGTSFIRKFIIPSSVTLIGNYAFYCCVLFNRIEIPEDSKLQIIGNEAFCGSRIKSIRIPSSVTLIGEGAFSVCYQLKIIEIDNEEIITNCQGLFQECENTILMIPYHS